MEIWKPLRNFPSYNGSSEGRIMNVRTQHILKPTVNKKGQTIVCLRKNNRRYIVRVHKLIAETFLGEHPGMDVRHKDKDRTNNRLDNLEWVTKHETFQDMNTRRNGNPTRYTRVKVLETNEIYNSVSECARSLDCCRSDIFKQLAGTIPHVKGYHFRRLYPSY